MRSFLGAHAYANATWRDLLGAIGASAGRSLDEWGRHYILRPGMAADLTVFDPATIRDVATFEDPNHYSVGIRHVFVNGRAVVADGAITTERPGRPLRGPGYVPPAR